MISQTDGGSSDCPHIPVVHVINVFPRHNLANLFRKFAAIGVVAINAAYRFQHTGLTVDEILERPEPRYWISSGYKGQMLEEMTPLPRLPGSLRIPLPYTELFGLGRMRAQNARG